MSHPTSVAGTRPVVAGCPKKEVAQVVQNSSDVTYRHYLQFPQDMFGGDDIDNGKLHFLSEKSRFSENF